MYVNRNQRELTENPQTSHLIYWDTLRSLLKTIREAGLASTLNDIASFYLVHEEIPSLLDEESIQLLSLPAEDTKIPISRRKLFLCAVGGGASFTKTSNFASGAFSRILHSVQNTNWYDMGVYVASNFNAHPKGDGKFTETVIVNKMIPITDNSEQEFTPAPLTKIGSFSVDFKISPTEDPLKESITILQADNILWDTTSQMHLFPEDKQILTESIKNWSASIIIPSHFYQYRFNVQDNEKMLRSLYKNDHNIPSVGLPFLELEAAVDIGMKRFWRDFYLTNKLLFSDENL